MRETGGRESGKQEGVSEGGRREGVTEAGGRESGRQEGGSEGDRREGVREGLRDREEELHVRMRHSFQVSSSSPNKLQVLLENL